MKIQNNICGKSQHYKRRMSRQEESMNGKLIDESPWQKNSHSFN